MRRSLGAFTGGRGRGIMAPMTEDFDGERIASARIAEEAERRTGFLDLSQLGLTDLPVELFALTHLRRLHLGWRLTQREGGWVRADWRGDFEPKPPRRQYRAAWDASKYRGPIAVRNRLCQP